MRQTFAGTNRFSPNGMLLPGNRDIAASGVGCRVSSLGMGLVLDDHEGGRFTGNQSIGAMTVFQASFSVQPSEGFHFQPGVYATDNTLLTFSILEKGDATLQDRQKSRISLGKIAEFLKRRFGEVNAAGQVGYW